MASNHPCHCHSTQPPPPPTTYHFHPTAPPPPPITTTCHCTTCYTTTHYPSPTPQQPQTHLHAPPQHHHPPQPHLHAPPHHHHNPNQYHHPTLPQQEPIQEDPTVTSLIHRISALETTLRRRTHHHFPQPTSLRDTAARVIQTHFRSYLIHRSITLRNLKDLAFIKSSLNNLKSYVSNKTHFDSNLISRESMNLLIKLDSIQGNDQMIRDGKRSVSRELVRFMELIDEISMENELISIRNVKFGKTSNKSVILQRESKIRGSGSRVHGDDLRNLAENLKNRIEKLNGAGKRREDGGSMKSQRVVKTQPNVKKNVSFDENGNVYRLIERKRGLVLSDASESSNGDDAVVEEIGVSKENGVEEEEEDSSEMSENEMDPRKNLGTQIYQTSKLDQPGQEEEEEEEEEDGDDFVFSAPLPAKMEYRVDSVSKKQAAKH